MTKYEQACEMRAKGYNVIPFSKQKKFNLVSWKPYEEKRTDEELENWWKKYPEANVAIITGKISNLTVIDFDVDVNGNISERELVILKKLPPTLTVKTPSGGYHCYYKNNPLVKTCNYQTNLGLEIQVRSEGGLVGGYDNYCEYTKANGNKIKGWYRKVPQKPQEAIELDVAIYNDIFQNAVSESTAEEKKYEAIDWAKLPEKSRNDHFYKHACSMFGRGMRKEEIKEYFALKYQNLPNKVDFTLEEIMKSVDSAEKYKVEKDSQLKLGEIEIVKTELGYLAKTLVKDGYLICHFTEMSFSSRSAETLLEIELQVNQATSSFVQRLDIRSNNSIKNLVTDLNNAYGGKKDGGYNWGLLLNNIFAELTKVIRNSQKPLDLTNYEYKDAEFLIKPFLQKGVPNLIFSQPEVGKSFFALKMAISLALGNDFLIFPSTMGKKTLYIDYEDTIDIFSSRLHMLCDGLNVNYKEVCKFINYQNLVGSVRDNVELIRRIVAEDNFELIIIDSGGDACGGSPSDEAKVLDFHNALQEITCTKLIIHHEPKNVLSDSQAIYGSTYWRGRSRVAWRLEIEADNQTETIIKLVNRKKSNLPRQPIYYYKQIFNSAPFPQIILEMTNVETQMNEREQILAVMGEATWSISEIVEETGLRRTIVDNKIRDLKKMGIIEASGRGHYRKKIEGGRQVDF